MFLSARTEAPQVVLNLPFVPPARALIPLGPGPRVCLGSSPQRSALKGCCAFVSAAGVRVNPSSLPWVPSRILVPRGFYPARSLRCTAEEPVR